MADIVNSINQVPIRLTDERWTHIVENHNDLAGHYYDVLETLSSPDWVLKGNRDELWAIKFMAQGKVLLVIYKELKIQKDGFVITAFITTKIRKLSRRKFLWRQPR